MVHHYANETAEELARALGGKRCGKQWLARYPAREDRSPNLSLTDPGEGLMLWRYHAGCSQADVRDALVARGLWPRRGGSGAPMRRAIAQPALNFTRPDQADPVARLWRDAVDPRGTLAERHLNGRGLALDDDLPMRVLRFMTAARSERPRVEKR